MSATAGDVYDLQYIDDAACNIAFCLDPAATTLALARSSLKGFKDFGHCLATDISPSQTTADHKSVRMGKLGTDRKTVTDSKIEIGIKLETLDADGVSHMLMGDVVADRSQTVLSSQAVDTLAFTTGSPSQGENVFYNVTHGGVQYYALSACTLVAAVITSVTFDASPDVFTKTGHGLLAGQPVQVGGTPPAGGFILGTTTYYLVNVTVDTFQVSAAPGGTALTGTDAGSNLTIVPMLVDDVSCKIDFELGRVRFLYPMVTTVTPTIAAPVINKWTNADKLFRQVTPMTNGTKSGWAQMVVWHDGGAVGYYEFQAQLTTKGGSGWDASKAAQYDLTITVLADAGTFGIRANT
jgi:hypothetical protein